VNEKPYREDNISERSKLRKRQTAFEVASFKGLGRGKVHKGAFSEPAGTPKDKEEWGEGTRAPGCRKPVGIGEGHYSELGSPHVSNPTGRRGKN